MYTGEPPSRHRTGGALSPTVDAVLGTVALYTLAGWGYIVLNALVHPMTLPLPLTHLLPWPREDTFGIVCFAVSFACTLVRRVLRCRT